MLKPVSSSSAPAKRPAPDCDRPVSPPPLKRRAHSTISKSAVASFFAPASQKPKDLTTWTERRPGKDVPATLLVARHQPKDDDSDGGNGGHDPETKRRKIAAFDLDATLITTASGKKHSDEPTDWKWFHPSVLPKVRKLYHEEGYHIVILSNQAGLTLHPDPKAKAPKHSARLPNFKRKCAAVLAQLGIPLTLYAATAKDIFRKPRPGMWDVMCEEYGFSSPSHSSSAPGKADSESDGAESGAGEGPAKLPEIDLAGSIFVGDAAGRAKDFSCSDRDLAHNLGIRFQTPEEFFLGQKPAEFKREFDVIAQFPLIEAAAQAEVRGQVPVLAKTNEQDIVLLCGSPGAGKSTFFWKFLEPLGYERVNQDMLKRREKCLEAASDFLDEGRSVAVDSTNADVKTRALWVELAARHKVPIRCVWLKTPPAVCEHNDAARAMNKELNPEGRLLLPMLAFKMYRSRFEKPEPKEGFQDIVEVDFTFRGTGEDHGLWARYWL